MTWGDGAILKSDSDSTHQKPSEKYSLVPGSGVSSHFVGLCNFMYNNFIFKSPIYKSWLTLREKIFYVPPARKLVFSLQLTVAQCSILRYRGMKCKNWTAHAPIAMQRSTIIFFFLFFFFFVQRWHCTDKDLYIWTAHALLQYATTTQDRENQNGRKYSRNVKWDGR